MTKQSLIAEQLNLSQQTVSRAIRQPHLVREQTRRRVLETMQRNGYQVNELANRFKSRSLMMLGVCLPSIQHDYFPSVAHGMEAAASQRGWQLSVTCSHSQIEIEQQHINTMRSLRFGGVACRSTVGNGDFYRQVIGAGFPLVMIDCYLDDVPGPYVGTDNRLGVKLAVDHLAQLGHRRIALVSCDRATSSMRDRHAGFLSAMAAHSLPVDPKNIVKGGFTPDAGRRAAAALLALPEKERPTAIFCDNDLAAAGVELEVLGRGLTIPGDLSVVGFSGLEWTSLLPVPLTTLNQHGEQIGEKAAMMLFSLMGIEDAPAAAPMRVELPPTLVVRASTGPAQSIE